MSDLTKLTAEELMRFSPDVEGVMPEIRRRLERLEQCEAALKEARFLLCTTTKQHLTMQPCQCKVCQADRVLRKPEIDAARAALEGKK